MTAARKELSGGYCNFIKLNNQLKFEWYEQSDCTNLRVIKIKRLLFSAAFKTCFEGISYLLASKQLTPLNEDVPFFYLCVHFSVFRL